MNKGPFNLAQGYIIIPPQPGKAYPILCSEWAYVKNKIKEISNEPLFFHTIGSLLLGAGLSTLVSILLGTFSDTTPKGISSNKPIIAWAVVIVTVFCGCACWYFSHRERKQQKTKATDVVAQMDLIESRYQK